MAELFSLWGYLWWPVALALLAGSLTVDAYVVDKLEDTDRRMQRKIKPGAGEMASLARTVNKSWIWNPAPLAPMVLLMIWLAPLWLSVTYAALSVGWAAWVITRAPYWRLNSATILRDDDRTRTRLTATYSAVGKMVLAGVLLVWGVVTPLAYAWRAGAKVGMGFATMQGPMSRFGRVFV